MKINAGSIRLAVFNLEFRTANPEFIFATAYYEAHSINFLWLSDSCRPGYDPVWFSIVIGVTVMIGVITPPVAVAAFIVKNITQESIAQICRGVVPFLITLVLSIYPGNISLPLKSSAYVPSAVD